MYGDNYVYEHDMYGDDYYYDDDDNYYDNKEDSPRRYFGSFRCPICNRFWHSGHAWEGAGQSCNRCAILVYPFELRALERGDNSGSAVIDRTIQHPEDLCEKCQELGYSCVKFAARRASEDLLPVYSEDDQDDYDPDDYSNDEDNFSDDDYLESDQFDDESFDNEQDGESEIGSEDDDDNYISSESNDDGNYSYNLDEYEYISEGGTGSGINFEDDEGYCQDDKVVDDFFDEYSCP